jgi:hypothetical protein
MIHMFPPRRSPPQIPLHLDSARWTALSKAAAALAVEEGELSAGEACDLCDMDAQELEVWQRVMQDRGLRRNLGAGGDR